MGNKTRVIVKTAELRTMMEVASGWRRARALITSVCGDGMLGPLVEIINEKVARCDIDEANTRWSPELMVFQVDKNTHANDAESFVRLLDVAVREIMRQMRQAFRSEGRFNYPSRLGVPATSATVTR